MFQGDHQPDCIAKERFVNRLLVMVDVRPVSAAGMSYSKLGLPLLAGPGSQKLRVFH